MDWNQSTMYDARRSGRIDARGEPVGQPEPVGPRTSDGRTEVVTCSPESPSGSEASRIHHQGPLTETQDLPLLDLDYLAPAQEERVLARLGLTLDQAMALVEG